MTSRLQNTTPKKLIKALKRLGFVIVNIRGSHYIMRRNEVETCVPYHSHELPRHLLMAIIKQAGLTIEDIRQYL